MSIERCSTVRAVKNDPENGVHITRRGRTLCLAVDAKHEWRDNQLYSSTYVWKARASPIARAVQDAFWWWMERMPGEHPKKVLDHAIMMHDAALAAAHHRARGSRASLR